MPSVFRFIRHCNVHIVLKSVILSLLLTAMLVPAGMAIERPEIEFSVFQFPRDMMPRIDGDTSDWDIVPDSYTIGIDQLKDTMYDQPTNPADKDVNVKVGWVNGMNRLYFLVEAYDDYWDFSEPDLHNDIFELVVDGDISGGGLIPPFHPADSLLTRWEKYYKYHGVQAQNYHIFTPAEGKPWTMVWGSQPWIYHFPWANAAYDYNFKHGESGRLVLEFWVTPFDYAPYRGPEGAVVSELVEGELIGLSWSILEYDGTHDTGRFKAFWNLSHKSTMYGNASELCAFRLKPLDDRFRKPLQAEWSYTVIDQDRRLVAFTDESYGEITSWAWDFGDGTTSTEQHPIHQYEKGGQMYVVVLWVEGPEGKSRMAKVWDVAVK